MQHGGLCSISHICSKLVLLGCIRNLLLYFDFLLYFDLLLHLLLTSSTASETALLSQKALPEDVEDADARASPFVSQSFRNRPWAHISRSVQ